MRAKSRRRASGEKVSEAGERRRFPPLLLSFSYSAELFSFASVFFPLSSLLSPSLPPPGRPAVPRTERDFIKCAGDCFQECVIFDTKECCVKNKKGQRSQLPLSLFLFFSQGCCCPCCSPAQPSPFPSPPSATGTYMKPEGRAWLAAAACPGVITASAAAVAVGSS